MADFDPGGLTVAEQVDPADVRSGDQNGALQLASALAQTQPEVNDFVGQLGGQLQARAQARAQQASFAQSGEALGDAVREGKIEPTQNPWFIQAYNKDSAELRAKGDISSLLDKSQTWAERNDPAAYQARFAKEMGQLGQSYTTHPETLQGFEEAATPLYNQAVASNQQYNVQRIQQDYVQTNTQLMEQRIQDTLKLNPNAAPADVLDSLTPLTKQIYATGGTDSDVKKMAFQAIMGAAYNAKDPGILSLAHQSFQGGLPLAEIADEQGKTFGQQLGYAEFDINRQAQAEAMNATRGNNARITQEGNQVVQSLLSQYGLQAIAHTTPSELQAIVSNSNGKISLEGALQAAKMIDEKFQGLTGVNKELVQFNQNDPDNIKRLIDYHAYGATHGLTPSLTTQLSQDAAKGLITWEQADGVISEASSTARTQFSEGMANKREARSEASQSVNEARRELSDAKTHATEGLKGAVGAVLNNVYLAVPGSEKNPQIERAANAVTNAAYFGHLSAKPQDYDGAVQAAQQAAGQWGKGILARRHGGTTVTSTGGNPLGGIGK